MKVLLESAAQGLPPKTVPRGPRAEQVLFILLFCLMQQVPLSTDGEAGAKSLLLLSALTHMGPTEPFQSPWRDRCH